MSQPSPLRVFLHHCKSLKWAFGLLFFVSLLSACTSTVKDYAGYHINESSPLRLPQDFGRPDPFAQVIQMPVSRWVPASWSELPGWDEDSISSAWAAWERSCRVPAAGWQAACQQIIALSDASEKTKRQWMYDALQPYRVEAKDGSVKGMLTAYYEPVFRAHRKPVGAFKYPLHLAPADLKANKPYWTRQQIESNAKAQNTLSGLAFAYLEDPLDVMILHIQGSGQLILTEEDGSVQRIRAAYAASNNHPYHSIGRYMLDKKYITDATWPGIKQWLDAHPTKMREVLWMNPRYIFFKEEFIENPSIGPVGAQGVPLTSGRSIAVDKTSLPYGSPVWISSKDTDAQRPTLNRLVLAQDTGSAIVGAVRADYFWGQGPEAGDEAGRTKQALYMWTFLPRQN